MGTDWLVSESLAPDTTDLLAPLYAAAGRGVLALPFCPDCQQVRELDQQVCDRCRSLAVEWREVEPLGVVHAATMVHRLEPGLVVTEDPYPILDVELRSGHRLVMTTTQPTSLLPSIGQVVTIEFRSVGPIGETVSVPAAAPATPQPASAIDPEVLS